MYFPPEFQVLFLSLLAAFGWSANLRILSAAGVRVELILQLRNPSGACTDGADNIKRLWQDIARLARVLSAIAVVGWLLCVLSSTSGIRTGIALGTYLIIFAVLLMPRNTLCHSVRLQFLGLLARIAKPSLSDSVYLADIVMADILTSCARMFADVLRVFCRFGLFVWPQMQSDQIRHTGLSALAGFVREQHRRRACTGSGITELLLVGAPYAFRLRQCINEYLKAPPASSDSKRHMANAIKYASSFPVIALSTTQRQVSMNGAMETKYSDWALHTVYGMWVTAVAFNSLYSFYWDIAFDWDLGYTAKGWKPSDLVVPAEQSTKELILEEQLQGPETHAASPFDALSRDLPLHAELQPRIQSPFLRPYLCFKPHHTYYAAMVTDLLLRITWTAKLSTYIQIDRMPYGSFWLNALEIFRRWQWTFLRIEKEEATSNRRSVYL
ncbi:EXS-domain-containing protein [Coemansia reversa NRRL 1564]|uniref:EXS-domain-containing protein n=1 Tax=Coemansia reversa (strain ATCC 12441 / NRRL 1564) TaxID=763665 RepID=A0A2G5BK94_COERN|nr:EXS-domain-containing protein [Coemansia reversa NRRL 1564]|eukprot:PIA19430.1 EXS-domain-containing protein [Coemansia reversa NRRL 1564]